jgi:H+/gluconate symporter-like permease
MHLNRPNIMKNWKLILALWIALGVAVSGYFYIFPAQIWRELSPIERTAQEYTGQTSYVDNPNQFKVSVLITLVGSIIIFGVGKYYKKE